MKKIDEDEIRRICSESKTMGEACKKLQVSPRWLREKATQLGCWFPNQGGKDVSRTPYFHPHRIFDLKDWEDDKVINIARAAILRHVLKNDLIPYSCSECGLTEWNGKKITLDLDHINGNGKEHRKNNLRFLCPNCHSQTDTFRNKTRK